jgi:hypothetical protein
VAESVQSAALAQCAVPARTVVPAQPTVAQCALLEWIARLGAVTAEALALRRGVGLATASTQLLTAERAGLLACRRVLKGRPALFTPTRAGLRFACEPDLSAVRVGATNANHLIVCAGVAAVLERRYPDQRVQGERQLRRDERLLARPLASTRLRGGRHTAAAHHPDLVLWPLLATAQLPVAIEVELTIKSPRRLREICEAWADCRCVAGIVYLATSTAAGPVARAIEAAAAQTRIVLVALDSIVPQRSVPSAL